MRPPMTTSCRLGQIVGVIRPAVVFNLEPQPDEPDEQPWQLSSIIARICHVVRGFVFGHTHRDGFGQRLREFVVGVRGREAPTKLGDLRPQTVGFAVHLSLEDSLGHDQQPTPTQRRAEPHTAPPALVL